MDAPGKCSEVSFPDDVVERIIACFPFPYIFKARVLSKEWKSKFERVARSASSTWSKYCPTFLCCRTHLLFGFDGAHNKWFKMDLESVLLRSFSHTGCVEGVLLCTKLCDRYSSIAVINLLTGRRKTISSPMLPSSAHYSDCYSSWFSLALVPLENENYHVVLYRATNAFAGFVIERHVYDSSSLTWESKSTKTNTACDNQYVAYLDGCVYFSNYKWMLPPTVVQVNIEDGTTRKTILPIEWDSVRMKKIGVLRFGSRIICFALLNLNVRVNSFPSVVHLYEVQIGVNTLELVKLSEGSVEYIRFKMGKITAMKDPMVVASRDSICFCGRSSFTSYNVETNVWKTHEIEDSVLAPLNEYSRILPVAFEPGFNSFVVP